MTRNIVKFKILDTFFPSLEYGRCLYYRINKCANHNKKSFEIENITRSMKINFAHFRLFSNNLRHELITKEEALINERHTVKLSALKYNKPCNRQPEISLFTFLHGQNSSSPCTAISAILDPLGRVVF